MKKVLFVATVTKHINAFHIPYLRMLKEKGYEVHVASNGTEKIEYCDKHFNLNFARFPLKLQNYNVYKKLKDIIEENDYTIIHCHTPVGGVLTRLAAKKVRKIGTKVIYTAHGFHFYKGAPMFNWLVFYPIEKWLSKYTDILITINEEDYSIANEKFKAKNVFLVHGVGVNKNRFDFEMSAEEKNKFKERLGFQNNDFIIIQVGELNKNKNQLMSIKAMREVVKEKQNIHLLLVGEGKLEKFYMEKIQKYNLQNNVHLLGYRDDIQKLLRISNLLLSLSFREGLPVNVIEAMSCKLPIIVTNCRGNRDLITDCKNGYIINQKDIKDLVSCIKKLYTKKGNSKILGQASYKKAKKYWLDEVIKEYEKIYNI